MLYGLLKEQDTITEGELKDFIERQVHQLTPEQKREREKFTQRKK